MLKQVGGTMGDKFLEGNIPNMKIGEFRYYPRDNPNIEMLPRNKITRRAFIRIIKRCFPEYIVNPDLDNPNSVELKYYVGSVGINHILKDSESMYEPIVINKGYICVKEATPEENGTILYLHSGAVLTFRENYLEVNSK